MACKLTKNKPELLEWVLFFVDFSSYYFIIGN